MAQDGIIDFYLSTLGKQDPKRGLFVSFFWNTKMLNEGHKVDGGKYDSEKVIHWLDGKDVFARELFFFPFNKSNNHSILAIANLKQRVVLVHDSMGYNSVVTPSWKNHEKLKRSDQSNL